MGGPLKARGGGGVYYSIYGKIVSNNSPVDGLPLYSTKLVLQYCLELKSNLSNPANSWVFQATFEDRLEGNPEKGPLGICTNQKVSKVPDPKCQWKWYFGGMTYFFYITSVRQLKMTKIRMSTWPLLGMKSPSRHCFSHGVEGSVSRKPSVYVSVYGIPYIALSPLYGKIICTLSSFRI